MFLFLSEASFRPAAAGAEADEITHYKLCGLYRFDTYRDLELVAVDRRVVVEYLVAADLVVVDAAVVLGFLEVRIKRVDQALARIRCIWLVHEIPRDLVRSALEAQEQTTHIYAIEGARLYLQRLLTLEDDAVVRVVDRVVEVLLVEGPGLLDRRAERDVRRGDAPAVESGRRVPVVVVDVAVHVDAHRLDRRRTPEEIARILVGDLEPVDVARTVARIKTSDVLKVRNDVRIDCISRLRRANYLLLSSENQWTRTVSDEHAVLAHVLAEVVELLLDGLPCLYRGVVGVAAPHAEHTVAHIVRHA